MIISQEFWVLANRQRWWMAWVLLLALAAAAGTSTFFKVNFYLSALLLLESPLAQ